MYTLPSSISWCEQKYMYSEYVAEWWNAISGVCLCLSSIILLLENRTSKKNNILLCLIGVGTILFHGTLLYIWQLMDEIPMLLLVIEYNKYLSIVVKNDNILPVFKNNNVIIFVIIISYFYNPNVQIILFQGVFSIYVIRLLYMCYVFNKGIQKYNLSRDKLNQIYYNNRIGKIILYTSLGIWLCDIHMCYYVQPFQMHAWWHILTSVGVYYFEHTLNDYIKIHNDYITFS